MDKEHPFPTGNEKDDYRARKKFIVDFYANWIAVNTTKHIFNKSKIFTMYYEKSDFGKIKLTVGELRGSKQRVQYCITAIEND